jgi:predicted nucleic acid-binding protein
MKALLDSSALVAAIAERHPEFDSASKLLQVAAPGDLAVPAHAIAEAYSQLTRKGGPAPFALAPREAMAALELIAQSARLVGLSPAQTFDATRAFARGGGIGARLYDQLIGEVAVIHAIPAIVTLNVRHFRGLFPSLHVCTPAEWRQPGP